MPHAAASPAILAKVPASATVAARVDGVESTTAYCGKGCNPLAGTCTGQASPVKSCSPIASSPALAISKDARCGAVFGQTCLKSTFGACCSQYGFCGSSLGYCGTGCQSGYGTCSSSKRSIQDGVKRQVPGTAGPDFTMPPYTTRTVTVTGSAVVQFDTVKPTFGIATTTVYEGVSTSTVSLDAPTSGVSTITLYTVSTSRIDAVTPTSLVVSTASTTVFSTTLISTITVCGETASTPVVFTSAPP